MTDQTVLAPPGGPLSDAVSLMEQWAYRWGVGEDPYVAGIRTAVQERTAVSAWARLDPLDLLPHPDGTTSRDLRAAARPGRLGRTLAGLRNVLVFVPVAVTWYAIYQATAAFQAVRGAGGSGETTFLDVWISGAGDPTAAWAFPRVALLDAGLIAVVVIVSLLSGLLRWRGTRRVGRLEAECDGERVRVALALSTALNGHRALTPESLVEAVQSSLGALTEAGETVTRASSQLEQSAEAAAGRMLAASQELSAAASSGAKVISTATTKAGKSAESTTERVVSMTDSLWQASEAAVTQMVDASTRLHAAATGVTGLDSRLRDLVVHVEALVQQSSAAVATPLQEAQAALSEFKRAVQDLTTWTGADPSRFVDGFTAALREVMTEIERSGTSLEFGTMQLTQDLERLSGALTRVTAEASPA